MLGIPRTVKIGTRGALDPGLTTGDMFILSQAAAREGLPTCTKELPKTPASLRPGPDRTGKGHLGEQRSQNCRRTALDWNSIFAQRGAMVEEGRERGYGSVDMEAATLFAVAEHFGLAATALPPVSDQLTADRTFCDPSSPRTKPASTQPTPPYLTQRWSSPLHN